jgi:small GTP-binding protein
MGDPAVGKTSIRLNYMGEGFKQEYLMTLGTGFAMKRVGNHVIQIWDFSGQYSFKSIRKSYYRGALGAILVFDKTRENTLEHLENWLDEMLMEKSEQIPTVILGNKSDLCLEIDCLKKDTINQSLEVLCTKYSYNFTYLDSSAQTGLNVDKAFDVLVEEVIRKHPE